MSPLYAVSHYQMNATCSVCGSYSTNACPACGTLFCSVRCQYISWRTRVHQSYCKGWSGNSRCLTITELKDAFGDDIALLWKNIPVRYVAMEGRTWDTRPIISTDGGIVIIRSTHPPYDLATAKWYLDIMGNAHDIATETSRLMVRRNDLESCCINPLDTMKTKPSDMVVMWGPGNIVIRVENMVRLLPNQKLDDEIINVYMAMITDRSTRNPTTLPRCHCFNTFFFSLIPHRIAAITKRIDIKTMDLLFIPIHINKNHWCLIIVNIKDTTIYYYDPFGTENHVALEVCIVYM